MTNDKNTVTSVEREEGNAESRDSPLPVMWALKFTALGFLLCAIVTGLLMWQLRQPAAVPIVLHPLPTIASTPVPLPTATPGPVTVFISGEVHRPGLYELPAGSRVGEALAAAGGLLGDVDIALVNQAEIVFDGAQIHIPLPQPTEAVAIATEISSNLPTTELPPPGLSGNTVRTVAPTDALININTARVEELVVLPGIGPSKAAAIIANRPYASVAELERVPGIGPKTIAEFTPLITVQ